MHDVPLVPVSMAVSMLDRQAGLPVMQTDVAYCWEGLFSVWCNAINWLPSIGALVLTLDSMQAENNFQEDEVQQVP